MLPDIPHLSHEQQQQAVEQIHQLMMEGVSSGEAIAIVAQQIRQQHSHSDALESKK